MKKARGANTRGHLVVFALYDTQHVNNTPGHTLSNKIHKQLTGSFALYRNVTGRVLFAELLEASS